MRVSHRVKSKKKWQHRRYLVYTGYSIQIRVRFRTQSTSLSLSSIGQMERKNIRLGAFGLNSCSRLCTDIKFPSIRNKWIVYFNGIPDHVRGLFGGFCFVNEAQCHGMFTKKHLLKDEAVLHMTAAASQTISKWFHNALSGNDSIYAN